MHFKGLGGGWRGGLISTPHKHEHGDLSILVPITRASIYKLVGMGCTEAHSRAELKM